VISRECDGECDRGCARECISGGSPSLGWESVDNHYLKFCFSWQITKLFKSATRRLRPCLPFDSHSLSYIERLLGEIDGACERRRLIDGFLILALGVRVRDDPGARLHVDGPLALGAALNVV